MFQEELFPLVRVEYTIFEFLHMSPQVSLHTWDHMSSPLVINVAQYWIRKLTFYSNQCLQLVEQTESLLVWDGGESIIRIYPL